MRRPRMLLAEDHSLVADGIRLIVEAEFEVIDTALDGLELIEKFEALKPDIVVADVAMPNLNGIDALRHITKAGIRTKVVIMTGAADVNIATEAFRAGAVGFVLKHAASTELLTALREAQQGRTFITPRIAQDVLQRLMNPADKSEQNVQLTDRERQVLQLIAEGRSSKEAAALLDVAPRTIEFHKRNVMDKTGLRSTAELARYAAKLGIVSDPSHSI